MKTDTIGYELRVTSYELNNEAGEPSTHGSRFPNPQRVSSVFNPQPATRNRRSGFTLLEMLLAITILMVIVVIIGGAMRLGYRSADKGERKIESLERLRRSVEILEAQIQSSLPLSTTEQAETTSYFSGGRKALTIATNYSVWDGRRGYVVAEYTVRGEPSGKESLFVTEKTVGMETGSETVLLKDCDSVEFSYLEKGLAEEDAKWVEEWSTEDTGPERIKISIRYRAWKYSLVIPVRVVSKTT
jgi:general secretion pathway protein J